MSAIRPEHKATLMADGRWPAFVSFRANLLAQGVKPSQANERSVREFLGAEAAKNAGCSTHKGRRPKAVEIPLNAPAPEGGVSSVSPMVSPSGAPSSQNPPSPLPPAPALPQSTGESWRAGMPGPIPATKADFAGRECGLAESIMWVARNMDVADVIPADCPDAAAWFMMNTARMSALGRLEFVKSMLTKVVVKPKDEAEQTQDIDGTPQIATIDRIMDISKAAEKAEKKRGAA